MLDIQRALFFFAHPDDETLAAGGLINRLKDTCDVYVDIAFTGLSSRSQNTTLKEFGSLRKNSMAALKKLGVKQDNIRFGEFPDNKADSINLLDLIKWLEISMENYKPNLVVTHHKNCTNIDHKYCHEAAIVATRPLSQKNAVLLSAEIPSSTSYSWPRNFEPNLYIKLTRKNLQSKLNAMKEYSTEIRDSPHPRSLRSLESLAVLRGSECYSEYAEAFMLIRGSL